MSLESKEVEEGGAALLLLLDVLMKSPSFASVAVCLISVC